MRVRDSISIMFFLKRQFFSKRMRSRHSGRQKLCSSRRIYCKGDSTSRLRWRSGLLRLVTSQRSPDSHRIFFQSFSWSSRNTFSYYRFSRILTMMSLELLTSLRMQKASRAQAMSRTAFFSAERSLIGMRASSQSSSTGRRWIPRSESSQRMEEGVQLPSVRSFSSGQFSSGISLTEQASIQNLTLRQQASLHESSLFLALLGQLPASQLDVQVRLGWLYTPELPGHVWIVRASLLHVGDGLRPEDPASGLLVSGIVLDDCITRQHGPSIGCKVKLSKPERGLIESMQKNVFRNLVGNIERLLDQVGRQFELIQYL